MIKGKRNEILMDIVDAEGKVKPAVAATGVAARGRGRWIR